MNKHLATVARPNRHLTRTDGGRPSALTGWVGLSIFSSKSRKEANKCISNNSTFNLSPNIVL